MNPLMVIGARGKLIDPILIDQKPITYSDLLTNLASYLLDDRAAIHHLVKTRRVLRFRSGNPSGLNCYFKVIQSVNVTNWLPFACWK